MYIIKVLLIYKIQVLLKVLHEGLCLMVLYNVIHYIIVI